MQIEQEIHDSEQKLDYVFGVIQKPASRGKNFIIGWDISGNPVVKLTVREDEAITRKGYETRGRNAVLEFPFSREIAEFTPRALEFLEMAKPQDNADQGRQFTEDVVNIACANGTGSTSFLQVKERVLLGAIMDTQLTWGIGNPPRSSYSVAIPEEETGTLNFLLFSPGNGASNEFAYRRFLLGVIKTLATIDRNQNPPDQKGYVYVVEQVVQKLESLAQAERSQAGVLEKIQMEMGVLDQIRGVALLNTLPVDGLRVVLRNFKNVVDESFANGK